MISKAFGVGLLASACMTAAAGGAYVAVRQNNAPSATAAPVAESTAAAAQPSAPAVRETEALVTPPPQPVREELPALEAPAPKRAAVRRERALPVEPEPAPRRATIPSRPSNPAPIKDISPSPAATVASEPVATAHTETPAPAEPAPVEPSRPEPAAPALPAFEELVIPSSSVIGLQVETPVSSERARVEDRVDARVLRDVLVDGRTAIPAGSRAIGSVTTVERGGKVKERARLGVRFHTLVLADGTTLQMRTDAIMREGDSPAGESSRKIGGAAVGGAILGAILGGKKGAIVGGATGAAGGTAAVMAGDRNAASLPIGAVVTVRLSAPLAVQVERR